MSENLTVALVGNPNVGKTTLFNALTGMNHRTGNFPGVTVEWVQGKMKFTGEDITILDLPGTYSLSPKSPDEAVVVQALKGDTGATPAPKAVIAMVDASNPERNLYLLSQVLELGLPVVVALNMLDIAESKGLALDDQQLSKNLGAPVVRVQANSGRNLDQLAQAVLQAAKEGKAAPKPGIALDADGKIDPATIQARYAWSRRMLVDVLTRPSTPLESRSDRMDRILTHRFWGTLIFVALMALVFQSIYTWAGPVMDWVDAGVGWTAEAAMAVVPPGALQSLLVDGVIAGVGSVIIFLPQIAILFFFIAVMEGCGYMARAAFIMDKFFSRIGLSGRSFIPMFSSFACAVPGVMASRTIEDNKERLITMLVSPLMSCSARLPVYTIMIGAFVPATAGFLGFDLRGITLLAMYFLGVAVAVPVAMLLRKTLVKGMAPPFVMELPSYKWPEWRTVFRVVYAKCRAFLIRAGTVIFSVTVVIWAAAYYPRDAAIQARYEALRAQTTQESRLDQLNRDEAGEQLRQSYLGRMGRAVEPAFKPLGWDWRITMAAIASFPAREVIIATLGTIFNLGSEEDEESESLRDQLKSATWPDGRPLFNVAVAVSIMVFFALCAQCGATLAVIYRESGSWRWAAFTFVYMTALAYVGGIVAYQALKGLI